MGSLCIRVAPRHAQATREVLAARGWLDRSRAAAKLDGDVVFPVVDVPASEIAAALPRDFQLVRDACPPVKANRGTLAERLARSDGFPAALVPLVPRSFNIVGNILVLELDPRLEPFAATIAGELARMMPRLATIYLRGSARQGRFRTRELRLLWGRDDPVTLHVENGFRFKIDVKAAFFDPRLASEHARVAGRVLGLARRSARLEGRHARVLDLFCGAGPFVVPVAAWAGKGGEGANDAGHAGGAGDAIDSGGTVDSSVAVDPVDAGGVVDTRDAGGSVDAGDAGGARVEVVAVDLNPAAIGLLEENLRLNRVPPGRVECHVADAGAFLQEHAGRRFDVIIMNLPRLAHRFLAGAAAACEPGGTIFWYTVAHRFHAAKHVGALSIPVARQLVLDAMPPASFDVGGDHDDEFHDDKFHDGRTGRVSEDDFEHGLGLEVESVHEEKGERGNVDGAGTGASRVSREDPCLGGLEMAGSLGLEIVAITRVKPYAPYKDIYCFELRVPRAGARPGVPV